MRVRKRLVGADGGNLSLLEAVWYLFVRVNHISVSGTSAVSRFLAITILICLAGLPQASLGQDVESMLAEARSSRMKGKNREALETLAKASERFPQRVEPWIQMGTVLEDQGKWRDAMKCYLRAFTMDPSNPRAARNLNQLKSSRAVNEPLEANPAKEWFIQKGLRALDRGDFRRATEIFKLSRGLLWNDPRPLLYMAIAAERNGEIRRAIAMYEQTIEAFPDFAPARVNLVIALLVAGDRDTALKSAQESLAVLPGNRRLAYLSRLCKQRPKAAGKRRPEMASDGNPNP